MREVVLKIENVSKQYRLGLVGTGTLSDDLKRWFYKIRGKEDPFLKVGEVNDREVEGGEYVNALSDINLEIKKGEVVGIIGKNGAGKSTLLKLLSEVTTPTTGSIKVKGRIAALLEVGTGFHPELTGRENIFLNGAILGMTKKEIASKIEEIIEFSGVLKYLDTPVKRYSSGMKVRLGFAVAAYLEPDILVVDEVLAVGDLEFQKKCLGKMKDVAGDGRTVLFVSHNMAAIKSLCDRGIVFNDGELYYDGSVLDAISEYKALSFRGVIGSTYQKVYEDLDKSLQVKECSLYSESELLVSGVYEQSDNIKVKLRLRIKENTQDFYIGIVLMDDNSEIIMVSSDDDNNTALLLNQPPGEYTMSVEIPGGIINLGKYSITISARGTNEIHHKIENCLSFEVVDTITRRGMIGNYRKEAACAPTIEWSLE